MTEATVTAEFWELAEPFQIASHTIIGIETVHVAVSQGSHRGHGEGVVPVVFDVTMTATLDVLGSAVRSIESGADPVAVCASLPAGPARNALDCALWDLKAKSTGSTVWDLARIPAGPASLEVSQTIGLGTPEQMARLAARSSHRLLKIKLDNELVIERVGSVRNACPDAKLIVDANQSWSFASLQEHLAHLAALGVEMVEQPLPVGDDEALSLLNSPVPIFADEACHTKADLPRLQGLYHGVNIKLDKSGGLTEALDLVFAARRAGLGVMVGCMAGTSLSMAPAYVIGSLADCVDLDGPLLLAADRHASMTYRDGRLSHFARNLWG